jgi:uncharacterized membrane protein
MSTEIVHIGSLRLIGSSLLTITAIVFFWRGIRSLAQGLRNPDHPMQGTWVVRGFRGGIVGIGLGFIAAGIYLDVTWPLIFGAAFLLEELFETGIMLLALRAERRGIS